MVKQKACVGVFGILFGHKFTTGIRTDAGIIEQRWVKELNNPICKRCGLIINQRQQRGER